MRHTIAGVVAVALSALPLAHAQGCITQEYIELSGKCVGAGVPYRIVLTNGCIDGVTVYFDYPRWGQGAMFLPANSSDIHYGCTVERASVLGFCLWTDDHDKCGRGRFRNMMTSTDAFAKEVRERVMKIESMESAIVTYGIRNPDISYFVSEARGLLSERNRSSLSILDGFEDEMREIAANSSPAGREPLRFSQPRAVGSRVSAHRAAFLLYDSYDLEISREAERAGISQGAKLFEKRVHDEVPEAPSGTSAYQVFFNIYSERMRSDDALSDGLAKVLHAFERLEPEDRYRKAARGAIRAEDKALARYSLGRRGWAGTLTVMESARRVIEARSRAYDEDQQQRERRAKALQREREDRAMALQHDRETRQQRGNYMGQVFVPQRAEAIMFGSSNPDKFRVAPGKRTSPERKPDNTRREQSPPGPPGRVKKGD